MKYVLLTYTNYRRGAYVLNSQVEYATAAELISAFEPAAEVLDAVTADSIGHHFVDTPKISYQIVVANV